MQDAISRLWSRLARVNQFSFTASNGPGSQTDWRGHGKGAVEVEPGERHLLFHEQAQFTGGDGRKISMQNRYRWTRLENSLRLEHLRRRQPVLLFELQPVTASGFREVEAHLCAADTYSAELLLRKAEIELIWQIQGPRKNECLHYHYWSG
jgi:hypothetical protein